jgi:hypothetical protein
LLFVTLFDGAPHDHRLDEPELAHAACERLELGIGDPPRVGRVRREAVQRDMLDCQADGGRL